MTEHHEQVAFFEWVALQYPELELLIHAIPNGGHRHAVVGAKMKAEGAKRGVPDIQLVMACQGYHGLWIEMKFGKNTVSKDQMARMKAYREQGYKCAVCYGFYEAKQVLEDYIKTV